MLQWTNNRPVYPNELYHYGVMGMKWGIRNYQPYPSDYKGNGVYKGATPRHSGSPKAEYVSKKDYKTYRRGLKTTQRQLRGNAEKSAYLAAKLGKTSDKLQQRYIKKYCHSFMDTIKNPPTNGSKMNQPLGRAEKRFMKDTSKVTDAYRTANFWKAQSKQDFAKQQSHAKAVNKVYKDLKMKSYADENAARKGHIKKQVTINALDILGRTALALGTGVRVYGGYNPNSSSYHRYYREAINKFDPNAGMKAYKSAVRANKDLLKQEKARKNYLQASYA